MVHESEDVLHAALPEQQIGCGWVVVEETVTTKVLGLTVKRDERQFERQLFYCCPGETNPDPQCYQAEWLYRGDNQ
jgi:hypothetical protein